MFPDVDTPDLSGAVVFEDEQMHSNKRSNVRSHIREMDRTAHARCEHARKGRSTAVPDQVATSFLLSTVAG
jgi:hypothetical protein